MATALELEGQTINFSENLEGNKILENLRNQRTESKFCDIVLHVGDSKLLAHRSVLAASSPYFESILKNHRITKEDFAINWHDVSSFETLLNYMYSGEVVIGDDNVENLLRLSHHFHVSKLKNYCEIYLERFLSNDNCLQTRDIAARFNLEHLWEVTTLFIAEHINEVLVMPALAEFPGKKFESFIIDPSTGCDSVALPALLGAIAMWAKRDLTTRIAGYQKLLDVINWKETDPAEILSHLEADTLYQESKLCRFLFLRTLGNNEIRLTKFDTDYKKLGKEFNNSDALKKVLSEEDAYGESKQSEEVLADISVEPLEETPIKPRGRVGRPPKKTEAPAEAPVVPAATTTTAVTKTTTSTSSSAPKPAVEESSSSSSRRTRSSRNETATAVASIPTATEPASIIPAEENGGSGRSTRRRAVKAKFSSQEWVTDEAALSPPKKSRTEGSRSAAKKNVDDDEEDNVNFSAESDEEDEKQKKDATYRAVRAARKVAAKTVETDGDDDDDDDDSQDSKTSSRTKIGPNYASLAQWREGVKCPHCIYVGHSATRLEQHLARVHEENQTYVCKICQFQCKWNREFYKHMKEHLGPPPYKCEECDYTCDRIQFIISHKMRHTDERPFSCELCSFRSRTKGNLIVHMRIHTGEKPYRCQHCGRCFAMKNTLDQHLATHRDDRPFLCDSCGFSTKYQSHLLSHKRINTGNVFHCEQEGCNYFSPRRSQLAAHMRSHLSIRSHICSTCGRGFIEKSHLIRHERIHLDEKPFKCEQCDYGSTRRDKLKEHVLKHHSDGTQPKTPYKPRKPKNNRLPVSNSDELGQQIILDSQEIQLSNAANLSEQDIATANLIYEYAGEDGQVARVLIQPMGEFNETIVVEQSKEEN